MCEHLSNINEIIKPRPNHQLPGARLSRVWHYHRSDTPTFPNAILLGAIELFTTRNQNQDLWSCSRIQDIVLWDEPNIECVLAIAFLASNSLHNCRGQKLLSPCYNTKNFEQIH